MALLEAYLLQVGFGNMSCHQVGLFCKEHKRPRPSDVRELSKCVGHNAERDLHAWSERQDFMSLLPALYPFEVLKYPTANPDLSAVVQTHYALLPHEVFAALAVTAPQLFKHVMTGPDGNLDSWWAEAASTAARDQEYASWLASARAATEGAKLAADSACVRPFVFAIPPCCDPVPRCGPYTRGVRGCALGHARR